MQYFRINYERKDFFGMTEYAETERAINALFTDERAKKAWDYMTKKYQFGNALHVGKNYFNFASSADYANGIMTVTVYESLNNWDEIKMGTREARKLYFRLIDEAREEARKEEESAA